MHKNKKVSLSSFSRRSAVSISDETSDRTLVVTVSSNFVKLVAERTRLEEHGRDSMRELELPRQLRQIDSPGKHRLINAFERNYLRCNSAGAPSFRIGEKPRGIEMVGRG